MAYHGKMTPQEKARYDRQKEAMLQRARELQTAERLPLRELVVRLHAEGHPLANPTALSLAGLKAENFGPLPAKPAPVAAETIDAAGTPIEIARGMLRAITETMAGLPKDSAPYAKLSGEARQVTKLIAALERDAAGEETPEERERRLRREDGETALAISRYVDQALVQALTPSATAPHGRCPTCSAVLTAEARAEMVGGA